MNTLVMYAVIGVILSVVGAEIQRWSKKRKAELKRVKNTGPYKTPAILERQLDNVRFRADKPLTSVEQKLFLRLVEALPECVILAQVQLSRLVKVRNGPMWQTWFNKTSRKSLDFVVCLKESFNVVAVIELDDASHLRDDRILKDADKDRALKGAGLEIIRWQARNLPTVDEIRRRFIE